MGRKKKRLKWLPFLFQTLKLMGNRNSEGRRKKCRLWEPRKAEELKSKQEMMGKERETLSQRATRWGNELSSLQRHYYSNINSDFFVQIACIKFSAPKEMIPKVNGSFPTFSPLPSPFLPPHPLQLRDVGIRGTGSSALQRLCRSVAGVCESGGLLWHGQEIVTPST